MARMSQGLPLPSGNRGLLIIAALAGLAAAVLFVVAVQNNDSTTTQTGGGGDGGNTVVALKDIPSGTEIKAEMITTKTLDNDLLVAGAFDDTADVRGKFAANNITAGEQIAPARIGLANPANCGLGCVVETGN